MKFILYDFPEAARTKRFENSLYHRCVELSSEYRHVLQGRINIESARLPEHDGPQTVLVYCKKSKQKGFMMLSRDEVMLTLEIAAALQDIASECGIEIPDVEPVMQIH